MKKYIFVLMSVVGSLVEIFANKGFKVESYRRTAVESIALSDGTATCHSKSRS